MQCVRYQKRKWKNVLLRNGRVTVKLLFNSGESFLSPRCFLSKKNTFLDLSWLLGRRCHELLQRLWEETLVVSVLLADHLSSLHRGWQEYFGTSFVQPRLLETSLSPLTPSCQIWCFRNFKLASEVAVNARLQCFLSAVLQLARSWMRSLLSRRQRELNCVRFHLSSTICRACLLCVRLYLGSSWMTAPQYSLRRTVCFIFACTVNCWHAVSYLSMKAIRWNKSQMVDRVGSSSHCEAGGKTLKIPTGNNPDSN